MGRKNRLPSRSVPEPTSEERLQLLTDAVQAIKEDDVNKLLFCIPRGVDIRCEYTFFNGSSTHKRLKVQASLLHLAVLHHSMACTKFLLHLGGPKEASESSLGDQILHIAVREKTYEILQVLLDYGVSFNPSNKRGDTPLHIAARNGDTKAVNILLEEGADPKLRNRYGETPLISAVVAGTVESKLCADILQSMNQVTSSGSYLHIRNLL